MHLKIAISFSINLIFPKSDLNCFKHLTDVSLTLTYVQAEMMTSFVKGLSESLKHLSLHNDNDDTTAVLSGVVCCSTELFLHSQFESLLLTSFTLEHCNFINLLVSFFENYNNIYWFKGFDY